MTNPTHFELRRKDRNVRGRYSLITRTIFMGLLSTIWAACTGASAQWSKQKLVAHDVEGVVRVSLPKDFKEMPEATERTPDYTTYYFRKMNDTHINGQTSWAEEMHIVIAAKDFPRTRLDRDLASGDIGRFGRNPGAGEVGENGLRWTVQEVVYEQHPVKEPSWRVRLDNREKGLVIGWRGFKKTYTLAQAKTNLTELANNLVVTDKFESEIASRRSWKGEDWQKAFETNLRVAKMVLAEKQLALAATGSVAKKDKWRFIVNDERPQQLHLIYDLPSITLPEAPFRTIEKVTFYKFQQNHWYQDNQGKESDLLPKSAADSLTKAFDDKGRVYFFLTKNIDLWKTYASEKEFADMLRAQLKTMESEAVRIVKKGFIDGDAEP